jgi:hypothetical protein
MRTLPPAAAGTDFSGARRRRGGEDGHQPAPPGPGMPGGQGDDRSRRAGDVRLDRLPDVVRRRGQVHEVLAVRGERDDVPQRLDVVPAHRAPRQVIALAGLGFLRERE